MADVECAVAGVEILHPAGPDMRSPHRQTQSTIVQEIEIDQFLQRLAQRSGGVIAGLLGAERCLFGSNFPIEKLWTDYRALVDGYEAAIKHLDEHAHAQVMGETARRVYRLG